MNIRRDNRRGFTLIEILLVLVILGMLATVAIVAISGTREGARIDVTKSLIDRVTQALETYNLHIGHYPTEEEGGVKALLEKPTFQDEKLGEKWRGPYLKEEPQDAWGNPLKYELVDLDTGGVKQQVAHLSSSGPDKQESTEDDIKNWKEDTGS